ncbi:hypothetical protein FRC05_010310 [Tulasnella sp. 425]|nr:hypothetical protein FRC05_010310 [Tulasnella sp. 425]
MLLQVGDWTAMMLPQVYHSSETSYCVSGADASVIKLPLAESSVDTVIAAASEDAPAVTSQNALAMSGNNRVSVHRLLKAPSVPEEVASLKTRLAESEAVAEDLTRERAKALSTSRQLFTGLENLRNQKVQWAKEKDALMEKLRALDEEKATLVVSPPSEGVRFAGSGEQQHVKQLKLHSASPKPFVDQNEGTQRPEGKGAMKVRLGPLDEAPRIPEIQRPPRRIPPPQVPSVATF